MQKRKMVLPALMAALFIAPGIKVAMAADQAPAAMGAPAGAQGEEPIYGWQLMTPEERAEHRAKMRSFKTQEEREAYRAEQHKKMQERAKTMGKTIPDEPPPQGGPRGAGPGGGMPAGGGY